MADPCLFQTTILKHSESIAKHEQALDSLAPNIEKIATNVEILTKRLANMRSFAAGAAACGGAIVGIIVWIVKTIPVVIAK